MLQEELKRKCRNDIKWQTLSIRFIDDGFEIMEGTKKDVEIHLNQFRVLDNEVECMDLFIYKGLIRLFWL